MLIFALLQQVLLTLSLLPCISPEQLFEIWRGDLSSRYPPPLVPVDISVDENRLPKLQWKLYLERLQILPDYKLMFCLIGIVYPSPFI